MAASFVLTLDTTAPSVEFGEPIGATAGELLRVPYSSDESIERAELRLGDGRHLDFTIAGDELSVLLPPDTPAGAAGIRVEDEVGNRHLYAAAVVLAGVIVPVDETQPGPGFPARARPRARSTRRIRARSRVETRDRAQVRARGHYLSVAIARSGAEMRASSSTPRSRVAARSTGQIRAKVTTPPASAGALSRGQVRRGDGPNHEAALLLDLL